MSDSAKTLGQVCYDKYLASGPNPGRTYNDLPMPTWAELGETEPGRITRERWEAGALAVREALLEEAVQVVASGPEDPPTVQ